MHTGKGRERFVSAIFLHAGLIHYAMNMTFQVLLRLLPSSLTHHPH